MSGFLIALVMAFTFVLAGQNEMTQPKYPLTQINNEGCMAKGRVQDCRGTVMQRILGDGRAAIPVLISQLTETTRTKYEVADYWVDSRSGDVAYIILVDLFTDSDLHTFELPDALDWAAVMRGCDSTAQGCWDRYLRKHGRRSVQRTWMRAWNLHKDKAYWDNKEQCFRISKG